MLTDPKAIAIIANAKQKNVRDPNRSRQHFKNIFEKFLQRVAFDGWYLDMGPGQYDFGVMAKERGADQCLAIEYDPPVIELGEYLGFEVVNGNIKKFSPAMVGNRKFSGIFNKFSYNCFWYLENDSAHSGFVNSIVDSLQEDGWAWIAPWNGVPKAKSLSQEQIESQLERQSQLFLEAGFNQLALTTAEARKYGINGAVANNVIFVKNLNG